MSQRQFGKTLDGLTQALASGLSRRKALGLVAKGAVGALLAEVAQGATPVQAQETAQETYLPSLLNSSQPSLGGELCSDDPACADKDCCVTATAIDFGWFRTHLRDEILPKWLLSTTAQGLFLPHFDRQWRPLNRNFGTLISQCRLLYNFAQGFALTGDTAYRDAVVGGAQFLLDHFRDTQQGGWYWACNLDGTVRDNAKDSYGHAFVIFGLAHAFQCTGDSALQTALLQTWDVMTSRFRDSYGGYHGRMTRDFKVTGDMKSQNPVMHTFEALLAAGTVGGQAQLLQEARTVGNFVFDNLVRPSDRRLPEFYDMEWQELPGNADGSGGRLDIGHAFEWAYLAARAAELGFPSRFQTYANSFLFNGMALGMDWQNGGIYSPAAPNGVIINQEKGWWEQCETIRALTHFHLRHQRQDCLGPLQKMINFVKASMIDAQYGGWYPRIGPGITPTSLPKGNEWKVDYHVVGMCMEAIRLTA